MSVTYETPEEHLTRLLGRAMNSFELPDETISSLDSALAYDSSLHAAHHTAGLHRETHRHTFLLADGRALTLWELAYGTTQGGPTDHELYTDASQAELAASRLTPAKAGGSPSEHGAHFAHGPGFEHGAHFDDGSQSGQGPHSGYGSRAGCAPGVDPHADRAPHDPATAGLSMERQLELQLQLRLELALEGEVELGAGDGLETGSGEAGVSFADIARFNLSHPDAGPRTWPSRSYSPDDSADHARRLLRRAENADRPREHVAELLRTALAHQITQSFGRPCGSGTTGLGCALYEHVFLLTDGNELSLWELEHTATPDGRHMCEVYEDEEAARTAMDIRSSTSR